MACSCTWSVAEQYVWLPWAQELTQQVGAAAMDTTPAPHSSSGTQRSHLGLSSPLGQVRVLRGPKLEYVTHSR